MPSILLGLENKIINKLERSLQSVFFQKTPLFCAEEYS